MGRPPNSISAAIVLDQSHTAVPPWAAYASPPAKLLTVLTIERL